MTTDGTLTKARQANPYRKQSGAQILWGKVSGRYPATGCVDVTLDHGSILPQVPVAPALVGTLTGSSYLPPTDAVTPQSTPQGPYGLPTGDPDPTHNTLYALVAWLEGSGREPVVIGFLPAPGSAFLPKDPGWSVRRHESGQWEAIDPAGNLTLGWPDGSTMTVTTQSGPADPTTAINPRWPSASGSKVQVHLALAGGATVDIVGDQITLNGGTAGVARVGDTVAVDLTTGEGTITSGSTTIQAG